MVMHHRSRRTGIVVPLMAAMAVSACGGPEPSASPTAGAAESADPAPEASDGGVAELEATGEALPAGTYTRTGFEPTITFDLDGTWEAVQLFDGFFDVQQMVGSPDVIAIQFAGVSAVEGPDGAAEPADAEDAVEIASANPDLEVLETSESRIGGLTGSQVTLENAGEGRATVLSVPPGPLGIDPGRRLWVAFFDTDAGLLAIMIGGSAERWEEALSAAEPVLESVRIGP
jgi:hypothetical protein